MKMSGNFSFSILKGGGVCGPNLKRMKYDVGHRG